MSMATTSRSTPGNDSERRGVRTAALRTPCPYTLRRRSLNGCVSRPSTSEEASSSAQIAEATITTPVRRRGGRRISVIPEPLSTMSLSSSSNESRPKRGRPARRLDMMHMCIDLTDDEVIDLTNIAESPIILERSTQTTPSAAKPRRKAKSTPSNVNDFSVSVDDDDTEGTIKEPVCPICLETLSQIRSVKKQFKSTVCGHVFCSTCIEQAFANRRCCPTCRKRLTDRQIHPIFL